MNTITEQIRELVDLYESRPATDTEIAAYLAAIPDGTSVFTLRRACRVLNQRPDLPIGTPAPSPQDVREAIEQLDVPPQRLPARERPSGVTLSEWVKQLAAEGLTPEQIADVV